MQRVVLARKNWHSIVEEQRRWRELLYVEWSRHKTGHMPEEPVLSLSNGVIHSSPFLVYYQEEYDV